MQIYFIVAVIVGDNLGLNQILGCNESFPVIIFIEFAEQTKN